MTEFPTPHDDSLTNLESIPRLPERFDSLENQLHDVIKASNQMGCFAAADFIVALLAKKLELMKK